MLERRHLRLQQVRQRSRRKRFAGKPLQNDSKSHSGREETEEEGRGVCDDPPQRGNVPRGQEHQPLQTGQ